MLYIERSWKALIAIGYLLGAGGGLGAAALHCDLQKAGCSNPSVLNLLQQLDAQPRPALRGPIWIARLTALRSATLHPGGLHNPALQRAELHGPALLCTLRFSAQRCFDMPCIALHCASRSAVPLPRYLTLHCITPHR